MKVLYAGLLVSGVLLVGCTPGRKAAQSTATLPAAALEGSWELELLSYPALPFDSLYPGDKPALSFILAEKRFQGNSSCNRFHGPLVADARTISFRGDIAMTLMACPGDGEAVFLEQLKQVNAYALSPDGRQLTLIRGDIALLRFHRK